MRLIANCNDPGARREGLEGKSRRCKREISVSAVLNVFHIPFIIILVVRNRHGLLPLLAKS